MLYSKKKKKIKIKMSEGVYNVFTHRSTVSTDVTIGYAPINRLENGPYAKKDTA